MKKFLYWLLLSVYFCTSAAATEVVIEGEKLNGVVKSNVVNSVAKIEKSDYIVSCPFFDAEYRLNNASNPAAGGSYFKVYCKSQFSAGDKYTPSVATTAAAGVAYIRYSGGDIALDLCGAPTEHSGTVSVQNYSFESATNYLEFAPLYNHLEASTTCGSCLTFVDTVEAWEEPITWNHGSNATCPFSSSWHSIAEVADDIFFCHECGGVKSGILSNGERYFSYECYQSTHQHIYYAQTTYTAVPEGTLNVTGTVYKGDNSITSVVFKNCKTDGVNLSST